MDKLGLAAILMAAFVAAAFLGSGCILPGGGNETKNQGADPAALLLGALAKQSNYTTYTYEYALDTNGYKSDVRVVEMAGRSVVRTHDVLFEKTVYSNASGDVLCINFDNATSCSDSAGNEELAKSAQLAKTELLAANPGQDVKDTELRIKLGVIQFGNASLSNASNGKACELVRYAIDYSKITLEQLGQLGLGPGSAEVTEAKNQAYEYCIDNESNILYKSFSAVFAGAPTYERRTTLEISWGKADAGELLAPALVNANKTRNLFLDALSARGSVLACSNNSATKDECIKEYAIENAVPEVCLLAGSKKDVCILSTAPAKKLHALCMEVDNASMRDDCWIEMAGTENDSALCGNITADAKRQQCLGLFNSSAECASDAECFKAGCSGQLCVPAAQRGMASTCEYLPAYGCLNLTSCGCVQGKCAWESNDAYQKCLSEAK